MWDTYRQEADDRWKLQYEERTHLPGGSKTSPNQLLFPTRKARAISGPLVGGFQLDWLHDIQKQPLKPTGKTLNLRNEALH
jgi:hypothetical protein